MNIISTSNSPPSLSHSHLLWKTIQKWDLGEHVGGSKLREILVAWMQLFHCDLGCSPLFAWRGKRKFRNECVNQAMYLTQSLELASLKNSVTGLLAKINKTIKNRKNCSCHILYAQRKNLLNYFWYKANLHREIGYSSIPVNLNTFKYWWRFSGKSIRAFWIQQDF